MVEESYKHKGLRKKLVDLIRRKGIQDESVLLAIETIPRHKFMDSSFLEFAYEDKPFPMGGVVEIVLPADFLEGFAAEQTVPGVAWRRHIG